MQGRRVCYQNLVTFTQGDKMTLFVIKCHKTERLMNRKKVKCEPLDSVHIGELLELKAVDNDFFTVPTEEFFTVPIDDLNNII